eukprot:13409710-Ditylum_brightwellii.AAC.1
MTLVMLLEMRWRTKQIIGWDNLMKGLISIRWKVAQGMFKSALPNCGGFDRDWWATKVITGIWSIFRLI